MAKDWLFAPVAIVGTVVSLLLLLPVLLSGKSHDDWGW